MAVDPVASGNKCWTILWIIVAAEHQGHIWPGDIVVVHEYPQCDDLIPGIGYPDGWATPGGKGGVGIPGMIQHTWTGGFADRANEIRRVETKLGEWLCAADPARKPGPVLIPFGNRIMDSRPANTETASNSESKTIIEWMEENGLNFIAAGRDSGAGQGETNVHPGEQMINNALNWDRAKTALDPATGWMVISPNAGRGPKLWIMEHCTNLITAIQNYPGHQNGGKASAFRDFIDPLRYLIIADPYHRDESRNKPTGGVRLLFRT